MMMKLLILSNLLATLTFAEWNVDNQQVYNPPPDQTPKTYANWQQQFKQWVSSSPVPNLNLSHYTTFPSLKWTQTSFTQTQVMIHEKTLYNKTSNTFTVDKYLADLDSRYGGIDSVLLWPTYPNIGNDDRNQYDLHYSFDLQQLTDLVSDFHSHGVKVLWPYNPWDLYTRNTGKSDMESMGDLIQQTGADGFNGDTMDGVNASFFDEMISRDYPIAIEPEYTHANAQFMSTNFMSWNYWSAQYLDTDPPMVSAWKAVTNSLVMGHICERWATDRSDGLQNAFFNGMGYVTWENVWGVYNKITPRDGAVLKRTSKILRFFGSYVQTTAATYNPHFPAVTSSNDSKVYSTLFEAVDKGWTFYTLVNRNRSEDDLNSGSTVDLSLRCPQENTGVFLVDVYSGDVLQSNVECDENNMISVSKYFIEGGGYGGFLVDKNPPSDELVLFLEEMKQTTTTPLNTFSKIFVHEVQRMVDNKAVVLPGYMEREHKISNDDATVEVSGSLNYMFNVTGLAIEGAALDSGVGVDVQFPWEDLPQQVHSAAVSVSDLTFDKYPVTKKSFKKFLDDSGYKPALDSINFLLDWDLDENEDYKYGAGDDNKPVTWVSHTDAKLFCAFYGKRLPGSVEWQYSASGATQNKYPWGNNDPTIGVDVPTPTSGRTMTKADDVDAHPSGASWAGVMDLIGNVYQWTDVFEDEHTDRATLRGSSRYRPEGSDWYFPNVASLFEQESYLLASQGLDRSGGIGFRCVQDSE